MGRYAGCRFDLVMESGSVPVEEWSLESRLIALGLSLYWRLGFVCCSSVRWMW
jgi:hypothetical protein